MGKCNHIVAAVDVGTTKIMAVAGRKNNKGEVEILGVGKTRSRGVKRGVVLNIEETHKAISEAIYQVENLTKQKIDEVYVNIAGQHLKTLTIKAEKYIGENRIVSNEDIDYLFQQALSTKLPEEFKIYHAIPQLFTIDQEAGIPNPIGISGEKIEVYFKLLVAPKDYEEKLKLSLKPAAINIRECIIDPLASSKALLSDDEKEAGVVLLDIGGGTTKMAIFHDGVLCHSSLIPFGGNAVTHDIKEGCSILARQAESLKVQFGRALGDFAPEEKVVTIPGISGWDPKEISFKSLAYIIQARMEDIIEAFFYQLEKTGYLDKVGAGIVVTGGCASLPNLTQLIEFKTGLDVREGSPLIKIDDEWEILNNPKYSTVLGLLLTGLNKSTDRIENKKKENKNSQPGFIKQVKEGIVRQVTMFFEEEQDTEIN